MKKDEKKQRTLLGSADNQCKLEPIEHLGGSDLAAAFGHCLFLPLERVVRRLDKMGEPGDSDFLL